MIIIGVLQMTLYTSWQQPWEWRQFLWEWKRTERRIVATCRIAVTHKTTVVCVSAHSV